MTELGGKPYRLPLQLYIIYWGRQNEKPTTFTTLLPLKEAFRPEVKPGETADRWQDQCGKGKDQKPARQRCSYGGLTSRANHKASAHP